MTIHRPYTSVLHDQEVTTNEARVRAEAALRMLEAGETDQARILFEQAADWLREA